MPAVLLDQIAQQATQARTFSFGRGDVHELIERAREMLQLGTGQRRFPPVSVIPTP
jgi:hypothetical protein